MSGVPGAGASRQRGLLRRLAVGGPADGAHAGTGPLPRWAARRSLRPGSLAGLALLLAVGAAAWFSGGTGPDNLRGVAMLAGWYLASRTARLLGEAAARRRGGTPGHGGLPAGSTDWLAPYPPGAARSGASADGPAAHADVPDRWLTVCGAVAEYAVYIGISAGGHAAGWPGMWPLGAAAIAAVAVLRTLRACLDSAAGAPPAPANPAWPDPASGPPSRWPFSRIPVQAATAAQATAGWGDGYEAPGRRPDPGGSPGWHDAATDAAAAAGPTRLTAGALATAAGSDAIGAGSPPVPARRLPFAGVLPRLRAALGVPGAGRLSLAAVALLAHGPRVALVAVLACAALPAWRAVRRHRRATRNRGEADAPRPDPATVIALRDDGALVRWVGLLVRGNLPPLPGAVAGLAGTTLLAVVGMNNVLGLVKLAPPIVMLLAAPGASHRHDGRSDWLVPAIMQAGQYLYLGALGQASGVPGPLIAVLFALTGLRSAVAAADPAPSRPGGGALGWEGRLLCCGLAAMAGLATAGFAVIACYLAVRTGRRTLAGYVAAREA